MLMMQIAMIVRVAVGLLLMNMLVRMGRLRLGGGVLVPMVLIVAVLMAVG